MDDATDEPQPRAVAEQKVRITRDGKVYIRCRDWNGSNGHQTLSLRSPTQPNGVCVAHARPADDTRQRRSGSLEAGCTMQGPGDEPSHAKGLVSIGSR